MINVTFFKTSALVAACSALMACGGGGGGSSAPVVSAPVLTNIAAQGLWQSAVGASTDTSTVVTDSGQVWSVLTTAGTTRLLKGSLAISGAGFAGTGKAFLLGTTTVDAVTLSASAVAKTSLNGSISSTTAQTEAFSLGFQTRYDTPVKLADFAGAWSATLGPGTVSWSISSSGVLTGTRTTGCTYSGQLSLRPEAKAVADIAITESCPAVTQLSGVAVKTVDNKGITLLMTTAGDAQAVVLGLR